MAGTARPRRSTLRSPLTLVALGAGALYLLTLARWHTWDAIAYTARAYGNPLLSERFLSTSFFHPHHLLYLTLARGFLWLSKVLIPHSPDPFFPLQLMSVLFGASSVFLVGYIVLQRTGSTVRACVLAAMFALSQAVWRFSTEVEVMLPALFFCLCAVAMVARRAVRRPNLPALALLTAIAILIHQIAFLFFLAMMISLLSSRTAEESSVRSMVHYGGSVTLVVVIAYLAGAMLSGHLHSPSDLIDWILFAASRHTLYPGGMVASLWVGLRGFLHAIVTGYGASQLVSGHVSLEILVFAAALLIVLVGMLFSVSWIGRSIRSLLRSSPSWVVLHTVWFGITALFIVWLQPFNIEFWIYCLPALILLLAESDVHLPRWLTTRRWRKAAVAYVFLLSLGWLNFRDAIASHMEKGNAEYSAALELVERNMEAGDLILRDSSEWDTFGSIAIPFFSGVDELGSSYDEELLLQRVQATLTGGGRVFVTEAGLNPALRSGLRARHWQIVPRWLEERRFYEVEEAESETSE